MIEVVYVCRQDSFEVVVGTPDLEQEILDHLNANPTHTFEFLYRLKAA